MSSYSPPLEEHLFALNHVADLSAVAKLNGFQHIDSETVGAILDEAGRFFAEVMAPLNRVGDTEGSQLTDAGTVKTPSGFKDAYDKFVQAGWSGAHLPEEHGGGGLPYTVGVVIQEMFKTANIAFSLCGMLTQGAVEALVSHGSDELKATYLEKLVSGEWTGTMNLTEPEAGSDLGALRAKAVRQEDGSYRIFGTKIFITWGDHDLTDNIVHLVLARTDDAPPGTRGISMFLVPKYALTDSGDIGEANDIKIVSIEHKLGIHASPTCVISFGDAGEGALGYVVGEEMSGMRNMFTMMNAARVGVGMEGLAMAERAYQTAATFAKERVQGRAVGSDSKESVAIVEHPDVRRMLLTMRANNEAMRGLLYLTAMSGDLASHGDAETQDRHAKRLALLTPIVKAWMTDLGVEMASLGIQVHGGMGYVEETRAAQYFRDARIAPIYEGTNGIQAIDLVLRKLPVDGGKVVEELITEMTTTLDEMSSHEELGGFRDQLTSSIQGLADTSAWLGERLASGNIQDALAGATPYLTQFGTVLGGWMMAKAALAAKNGAGAEFSKEFLDEKVITARFYGEHLLPRADGLVPTIKGTNDILAAAKF